MLPALIFCAALGASRAQLSADDSVLAAGIAALRDEAAAQAGLLFAALPADEQRAADASSTSAMLRAVASSRAARSDKQVRAALASASRRIEPAAVECVLLGDAPPAFVAPQEFYGTQAVYESRAALDATCATNEEDAPQLQPLPPAFAEQLGEEFFGFVTTQSTLDSDLGFVNIGIKFDEAVAGPVAISQVRGALLPALVAPSIDDDLEERHNILPAPIERHGGADASVTAIGATCVLEGLGAFNPSPLDLTFALSRDPVGEGERAGLCINGLDEQPADANIGVVVGKAFLDTNADGVRQPTESLVDLSEDNILQPFIFSLDTGSAEAASSFGTETGDFLGIYEATVAQPAIGLRTSEGRFDTGGFALVPELCGDDDPRLAVTRGLLAGGPPLNILLSTAQTRDELPAAANANAAATALGFVQLSDALRAVSVSIGVRCVGEQPNSEAPPIVVEPLCGVEQLEVGQAEVVDTFRVTATRRQVFAEFQTWLVAASIGDAPTAGASPLAPTVTTDLPRNVGAQADERVTRIAARSQRGSESLTGGGPADEMVTFMVEVRTPYATDAAQRCPGLAGAVLRNELALASHSLSGMNDAARLGDIGAVCAHRQAPECVQQLPRRDGAYIAAFMAFSIVVACVCCALSADPYRARGDIERF